jgi:hypothetical protein
VKASLCTLALLVLLSPLSARAATPGACPASKSEVTLLLRLPEAIVDNSLPQPRLQELSGKAYHDGRTMGLYRMELQYGIEAAVMAQESAAGLCQWIERVTVRVILSPRQIYVVRERKPGTCPYDAVLAHERKHKAIDDEVFRENAPRLKRVLEAAIAGMPVEHPVPPAEEAASKTRLVAPLRQVFQSAIDDVMAERNARQARLDNPGEYKHVGGACG